MRLFLLKFVALICSTTLLGCSGSLEYCDPKNPGFFRNIACVGVWQQREDAKKNELEELGEIIDKKRKENVYLSSQKNVLLQEIKILEEELYSTKRYVDGLTTALNNRRLVNQDIRSLIRKIDRILTYTESVKNLSPEIYNYRYGQLSEELKSGRSLLEKFIEFGTGYVKDEIIFNGIKWLLPNALKVVGGRILSFISIGKTIYDAIVIFGSD